jgi:isochorismate synthase
MASLAPDSTARLPSGHFALSGRVPFAVLPVPDVAWACGDSGMLGWGVEEERVAWAPEALPSLLSRLLAEPSGPWLGGWAFDLARLPGGPWSGWPLLRFVRPSVLLRFGPSGSSVVASPGSERLADEVRRAWSAPVASSTNTGESVDWAAGDRDAWCSLHSRAVRALARGELRKIVLARSTTALFRGTVSAALGALAQQNPRARTFLVCRGDTAFLGATPETLCRVRGLALETEALAGTARPEDAGTLLRSAKDLREHAIVVEAIRAALGPHAEQLEIPTGPELVSLPNLVHLRTPIRARLRSAEALAELVPALHPTPAVNGWPRAHAQAFLREEERLERGWFAGVVGCVEPGNVELRVALRSALLSGGRVHAFAGAGVVEGSEAHAEWEETSRKMATVQAAMEEAARG